MRLQEVVQKGCGLNAVRMRSERGLTRDPRQKSRRRTWNLKAQMEPGGRRWSLEGAGGAWEIQMEDADETGDELNESCFNHFFQGLESSTEHFETCHKSIEEGSLQFNRTGF